MRSTTTRPRRSGRLRAAFAGAVVAAVALVALRSASAPVSGAAADDRDHGLRRRVADRRVPGDRLGPEVLVRRLEHARRRRSRSARPPTCSPPRTRRSRPRSTRKGLVEQPVNFTRNTLVIVVPKSNPAGIKSIYDLTKPGVTIDIANSGVPVGLVHAADPRPDEPHQAGARQRRQPGDRRARGAREGRVGPGRRRLRVLDRRADRARAR